MNYLKIIFNNLIYFRKSNLLFLLSTVITTAIITGSFIIGDSVRGSLKNISVNKLGITDYILTKDYDYFSDDLSKNLEKYLNIKTSSVFTLKGIGIKDGGIYRLNNINIIGVDDNFFEFSINKNDLQLEENEIFINSKLAHLMNLKVNDEIIVRVNKISLMNLEAPLARSVADAVSINCKVKKIIDYKNLGDFDIRITQIPQPNLFVSRKFLTDKLSYKNICNLMLIAINKKNELIIDELESVLKSSVKLEDIGLKLRYIKTSGQAEIYTDKIFIGNDIIKLFKNENIKLFTYFINEIKLGSHSTPYSFVTARDNLQLADNDIIINKWLADDLDAKVNDNVLLKYYKFDADNKLIEDSKNFRIVKIIDIDSKIIDRFMMPDYPGFYDISDCREWNPRINIDLSKIRPKDEEYWYTYRGTPKAIISFKTASDIWNNRFGNVTSVRINHEPNISELKSEIEKNIDPKIFGFKFTPIKYLSVKASGNSIDFGQLFMGLSSFIIIALVIFSIMIFGFNLEKRKEHIGILSALGFRSNQIFFIYFIESLILILLNFLFGFFLALVFVKMILIGLSTVWKDALSTSNLQIYLDFKNLALSFLIIFILIIPFIIKQIIWFLSNPLDSIKNKLTDQTSKTHSKKNILSLIFSIAIIFSTILSFFFLFIIPDHYRIMLFFISSFLFLISSLLILNLILARFNYNKTGILFMSLKNLKANKKQVISFSSLLSTGLFILFIIGINTKSLENSTSGRKSGTGGFDLYAELTNPISKDLDKFKTYSDISGDIDFINLRYKQFDDASCLNMNHVNNPSIIGLNTQEFENRKAFSFIETIYKNTTYGWSILNNKLDDGSIPAVIDSNVLKWSLNKKVGDILLYQDDNGNQIKVKLAASINNSIFQGKIIISEENFIKYFNSVNGYNIFLVDNAKTNMEELSNMLSDYFKNYGIDIQSTTSILNEFNKIENTYLSIFFILGFFGLLIGTFGICIIIIKNIYEYKDQIAVISAIGFTKNQITMIYIIQHLFLFLSGLIIGLISSLIVIIPMIFLYNIKINFMSLIIITLIIITSGIASIYFSVKFSIKENIIQALRTE